MNRPCSLKSMPFFLSRFPSGGPHHDCRVSLILCNGFFFFILLSFAFLGYFFSYRCDIRAVPSQSEHLTLTIAVNVKRTYSSCSGLSEACDILAQDRRQYKKPCPIATISGRVNAKDNIYYFVFFFLFLFVCCVSVRIWRWHHFNNLLCVWVFWRMAMISQSYSNSNTDSICSWTLSTSSEIISPRSRQR